MAYSNLLQQDSFIEINHPRVAFNKLGCYPLPHPSSSNLPYSFLLAQKCLKSSLSQPKRPKAPSQPCSKSKRTNRLGFPSRLVNNCYLQLFGCYPALGFTKRKKRMKIFQQSLQNRRLERKLKKLKDLVKKEKKEKDQLKEKVRETKKESIESPVPPTSADSNSHGLKRSLRQVVQVMFRASFTDYEQSKQRSKRKYYVHFLNTS